MQHFRWLRRCQRVCVGSWSPRHPTRGPVSCPATHSCSLSPLPPPRSQQKGWPGDSVKVQARAGHRDGHGSRSWPPQSEPGTHPQAISACPATPRAQTAHNQVRRLLPPVPSPAAQVAHGWGSTPACPPPGDRNTLAKPPAAFTHDTNVPPQGTDPSEPSVPTKTIHGTTCVIAMTTGMTATRCRHQEVRAQPTLGPVCPGMPLAPSLPARP